MNNTVLQLSSASFTANNGKRVLQDITLNVDSGDFISIIGSNGSGKSSLFKMIMGIYPAQEGEANFLNHAIRTYSAKAKRELIISLNQFTHHSLFIDMNIEENALMIVGKPANQSRDVFLQSIADELAQIRATLGSSMKTKVNQLSGGEQQLVAFVLYLRLKPKLLLLDEHTSALDPKTGTQIMEATHKMIQENGITCLMITHNLDHAEKYGNRLIAMRDGKIDQQFNHAEKQKLDKAKLIEYCY